MRANPIRARARTHGIPRHAALFCHFRHLYEFAAKTVGNVSGAAESSATQSATQLAFQTDTAPIPEPRVRPPLRASQAALARSSYPIWRAIRPNRRVSSGCRPGLLSRRGKIAFPGRLLSSQIRLARSLTQSPAHVVTSDEDTTTALVSTRSRVDNVFRSSATAAFTANPTPQPRSR